MIIIVKRYFHKIATVVKIALNTIRTNNYISKGIP